MKLITALQMRECDRRTIAGDGLPAPTPGGVLMERAGWGIYAALAQHFGQLAQRPLLLFCGRGNNGGDGLVLARHLQQAGLAPEVFLLAEPGKLSAGAAESFRRYRETGGRLEIIVEPERLFTRVGQALRPAGPIPPLLVDALLGTGSRGAPRGLIGDCVELIQSLRVERDAEVLAVDLPTGVETDTGAVPGAAVEADVTVTMAFLKIGFLYHPGRAYLGRVRVVDIGIPPEVPDAVGLPFHLMTWEEASLLAPQRAPDVHKARVGRLLIVGGSPGLTGAPALAAQAALRCGAGLVTVALPEGLNAVLEAKLTEVMTWPCAQTSGGELAAEAEERILARRSVTDVWALGPGIGRGPEVQRLVRRLLGRLPGPVVVDADGLFALATGTWQRPAELPPAVLTPHPGEMARLIGPENPRRQDPPHEIAARYAREHGVVLVLKGAPTVVATPNGEVWINPTGNAGLATGGSGDVLTGVIAALLGQGLDAPSAARLGVFLHGEAADRAAAQRGIAGLLPSDLFATFATTLHELAGGPPAGTGGSVWTRAAGFPVP